MKKTTVLLFGIGMSLALSVQLAAQQRGRPVQRNQAAASRAVYGTTSGLTYSNPVIGFRFTLPNGLTINEPHYVDITLTSTVAGSMFGNRKLTIKNVLTGAAHPVQFICTVMKLEPKLSGISGEQVLNDPLFRAPNAPKAKIEKLGNNTFAYVNESTRFAETRSYAFVRKGYYVSIVIMYKSIADLNILRETLAKADLEWNRR